MRGATFDIVLPMLAASRRATLASSRPAHSQPPARRKVFVVHKHLVDDETGKRLEEWVSIADLRPAQKAQQPPEAVSAYAVGDAVDIFVVDLWWEGAVVESSRGRSVTVLATRAAR